MLLENKKIPTPCFLLRLDFRFCLELLLLLNADFSLFFLFCFFFFLVLGTVQGQLESELQLCHHILTEKADADLFERHGF